MNYIKGLKMMREMNVAGGPGNMFGYGGAGGDFGTHGGAVGNSDFYAAGDARIPKILGVGTTDNDNKRKKGKKGKKKSKKIPVYRRKFIESLELDDSENLILDCIVYSKTPQYVSLISDILQSIGVKYSKHEDHLSFSGKDGNIQQIIEKVNSIITFEPFEQGEVVVLVGEMDDGE